MAENGPSKVKGPVRVHRPDTIIVRKLLKREEMLEAAGPK
jgi:hypothetical protein